MEQPSPATKNWFFARLFPHRPTAYLALFQVVFLALSLPVAFVIGTKRGKKPPLPVVSPAPAVFSAAQNQVYVLVMDKNEHPAPNVQVELLHATAASPLPQSNKIEPAGELGILKGTLPFPLEVIHKKSAIPLVALQTKNTNPAGIAVFDNVPTGFFSFRTSKGDPLPSGGIFVFSEKERPHLVLRLQQAPTDMPTISTQANLSVRTEEADQTPIPGVFVQATEGTNQRACVTDRKGTCTIPNITGTAIAISAQKVGFFPLRETHNTQDVFSKKPIILSMKKEDNSNQDHPKEQQEPDYNSASPTEKM